MQGNQDFVSLLTPTCCHLGEGKLDEASTVQQTALVLVQNYTSEPEAHLQHPSPQAIPLQKAT
jgi:hypothetical protein